MEITWLERLAVKIVAWQVLAETVFCALAVAGLILWLFWSVLGNRVFRTMRASVPVATLKLLLQVQYLRLQRCVLLLQQRYLRHKLSIAPGIEKRGP